MTRAIVPDISRPSATFRVVALLMLVVAFGHFNRISISVAGAERLIPIYGISETRMGLVYSGFLLVYTLCMVPGGWFIDRYGPRLALELLCAGSTVGVALTGLTSLVGTNALMLWASLLAVRCLMGAFNAPLHPASAHMVGNTVARPLVSLANGLVTFAACVGMAGTYYLFGDLMDHLDWPGAFYASSGLTFIVLATWVWLAPQTPTRAMADVAVIGTKVAPESDPRFSPSNPQVKDSSALHGIVPGILDSHLPEVGETAITDQELPAASIFRHRGLICLTLSYAALGYFQYLFFYWMQYYFQDVLNLGKDRGRLYSTLVVLGNGVGMVIGGWLADRTSQWPGRFSRALVPVAGFVGSAVVLVAGLMTSHATLTLLCFIAAMIALGMIEGPSWTTAVELGGRRGGTAAGLMNTGGNAGGLLAPVVTPQLSLWFGWQVGMGLAGLVALVGAVLWFGIDLRGSVQEGEKAE
jgi:MFS family permease